MKLSELEALAKAANQWSRFNENEERFQNAFDSTTCKKLIASLKEMAEALGGIAYTWNPMCPAALNIIPARNKVEEALKKYKSEWEET